MDQINNPRLRSMKEKTLRFNFKAIHVPGSLHLGPDAASRYPGQEVSSCMVEAMAWCDVGHERVKEESIVRAVRSAMEENETQAVTWEHIKMAAGADKTCRDLVMAFRAGFPEKKSMLEEGRWPLFSMKDELYEVE